MNDTNDTIDLRKLIDGLIDAREGERHIDPAAIAAEAMGRLGEAELRRVADLYIRQIARGVCRKRFGRSGEDEGDGPDPNQGEMFAEERFTGVLQQRYPGARSGGYVLRDSMSAEDVNFNVRRLRKEGGAKLDHADALELWDRTRRASGPMSPAA